jgi:hypothetical protein
LTEPPELRLFDVDLAPATEHLAPTIAAVAGLRAAELRDPRQMAFSVVGRGAAALLRSTLNGKRLTTALAIYGALADLSNDARAQEFPRPRKHVAAYAGVSLPTLDLYVREFERVGLLEVLRPRGGRDHTSNVWRLLQVDGDARGQANRTPNDFGGQANAAPNGDRGQANRTPLTEKKKHQEGNVIPLRDRSGVAPGRDFSRFDRVVQR